MTELSFLLDLLLNHKLPRVTRELIVARVKEVENKFTIPQSRTPYVSVQAASTAALMDKHGELPVPPAVIAQTPAAQAAVSHREVVMAGGKRDVVSTGPGTQGPRKW